MNVRKEKDPGRKERWRKRRSTANRDRIKGREKN